MKNLIITCFPFSKALFKIRFHFNTISIPLSVQQRYLQSFDFNLHLLSSALSQGPRVPPCYGQHYHNIIISDGPFLPPSTHAEKYIPIRHSSRTKDEGQGPDSGTRQLATVGGNSHIEWTGAGISTNFVEHK